MKFHSETAWLQYTLKMKNLGPLMLISYQTISSQIEILVFFLHSYKIYKFILKLHDEIVFWKWRFGVTICLFSIKICQGRIVNLSHTFNNLLIFLNNLSWKSGMWQYTGQFNEKYYSYSLKFFNLLCHRNLQGYDQAIQNIWNMRSISFISEKFFLKNRQRDCATTVNSWRSFTSYRTKFYQGRPAVLLCTVTVYYLLLIPIAYILSFPTSWFHLKIRLCGLVTTSSILNASA